MTTDREVSVGLGRAEGEASVGRVGLLGKFESVIEDARGLRGVARSEWRWYQARTCMRLVNWGCLGTYASHIEERIIENALGELK